MTAPSMTMQTICPYPACKAMFEIVLPESDPKATRPVHGLCPSCQGPAGFKPLAVVRKLEWNDALKVEPTPLRTDELMVLVEDIRSLWNVGSIFRTADGAGFTRVILTGITGCPPRKEIAKVSLGAEDQLPWQYCLSSIDIVPELKNSGVQIVGLERNQRSIDLKVALEEKKLQNPVCLIVGNEVTGLSPESLAMCDLICDLPMRGIKESLNVSVAFGVAAYLISNAFSSTQPKNQVAQKKEIQYDN